MKDGHGVARGQDEWFVRKGRQLEAAPRGEAVLWRQCHDERLADDNFAVQGGVTDRGRTNATSSWLRDPELGGGLSEVQ